MFTMTPPQPKQRTIDNEFSSKKPHPMFYEIQFFRRSAYDWRQSSAFQGIFGRCAALLVSNEGKVTSWWTACHRVFSYQHRLYFQTELIENLTYFFLWTSIFFTSLKIVRTAFCVFVFKKFPMWNLFTGIDRTIIWPSGYMHCGKSVK